MQDVSILLVAGNDEVQGRIFEEYFRSFPNATTVKDPFEEYNSIDCLVLPCPSSFARSQSEIVEQYFELLGVKVREQIENYILENLFGEQQPSTAFIIKIDEKKCKLNYKHIAFLCLCREPGNLPQDYAYTGMRGALLAIIDYNRKISKNIISDSFIELVAVLPFYVHPSEDEKRQATRQMSLAYKSIFYPLKRLPTPEETKLIDTLLFEKLPRSPKDKKEEIRTMLTSGQLLTRGIYNEEELTYLVGWMEEESELRLPAAKALASFLHKSPSEFALARETICRAITKSKQGLQYLLSLAISGTVQIHREFDESEYEILEKIGDGTEAAVYKILWEGKEYALKKFRGIPNHDDFLRELCIMSLLQHPNLLKCYGGQTKNDNYALVTELMEDNIFNLLNKKSFKMDMPTIIKIAIQVAKGMDFLHSCNLIHRDLKSVNLLIDSEFTIKVCDFGLSRLIDRERHMTGNVGTIAWIAPEIFQNQMYTEKADVYSFGIVLWELYTRKIPFEKESTFNIPILVIKGERPSISKDCPKDYAKLMKSCWHEKPSKRPSFSKIIKTLTKMLQSLEDVATPHINAKLHFKSLAKKYSSEHTSLDNEAHNRGYSLDQSSDNSKKHDKLAESEDIVSKKRRSGSVTVSPGLLKKSSSAVKPK
jgi:serine/threonine protein kinase